MLSTPLLTHPARASSVIPPACNLSPRPDLRGNVREPVSRPKRRMLSSRTFRLIPQRLPKVPVSYVQSSPFVCSGSPGLEINNSLVPCRSLTPNLKLPRLLEALPTQSSSPAIPHSTEMKAPRPQRVHTHITPSTFARKASAGYMRVHTSR